MEVRHCSIVITESILHCLKMIECTMTLIKILDACRGKLIQSMERKQFHFIIVTVFKTHTKKKTILPVKNGGLSTCT